jgi:hypothetical protein
MEDRFQFRVWKSKENRMVYDVTYLNPTLLDTKIDFENRYNVLMQSTGLKDKSGKLIYEGDIVKIHNDVIAKIIFDKGCFAFTDRVYNQACYWNLNAMEVIGNIYETPKLLESN